MPRIRNINSGRMSKRYVILVCGGIVILAFLLQAAWESPLRPAVALITDPGCRLAWYLAAPNYASNSTVWRFDLIATAVNTLVYSALFFTGAGFLRRASRSTNMNAGGQDRR